MNSSSQMLDDRELVDNQARGKGLSWKRRGEDRGKGRQDCFE